jgi:mTERF domain-containing protein, mitochondrial
MLGIRKCVLSHLFPLSLPSTSPIRSLHRLHSATANPSPSVENYLVASCGLSQAQALQASKRIAHLKPPSRPDAVLAFLAGLGLSRVDVAAAVANDPIWLYADVEKTLVPRVAELGELGLSREEVARLAFISQTHFRSSSLRRNLEFWIPVFGSVDKLLQALKMNPGLFDMDLEKVAKPNLALLRERGINVSEFSNEFMSRIVTRSTSHLQAAFARVDEFGLDQSADVFPHALATFASLSPEKLAKNIQLLVKLGWSRDDIALAGRKSPRIMGLTEERIRGNLEFLVGDVGLAIPYVARRPVLLLYSVERRLLPRHCLMNFLKAKGLLNAELGFYYFANMAKEKFKENILKHYEKSIPGLAAAYASSCAGNHQWEQLCQATEENITD